MSTDPVTQPAQELPGHTFFLSKPVPAKLVIGACTCGWRVTLPAGTPLIHEWHAHLDDVISKGFREP